MELLNKVTKGKKDEAGCPDILKRIAECKSFQELMSWCPFYTVYAMRNNMCYYPYACVLKNDCLEVFCKNNKMPGENSLIFSPSGENEYVANLVYTDYYTGSSWHTWTSVVKIKVDNMFDGYTMNPSAKIQVKEFTISKWKPLNKMLCFPSFWQDTGDLLSNLSDKKPWVYKFIMENKVDLYNYIMAPQLEQLHKAGYAFVSGYFDMSVYFHKSDVDCFNRICQHGNDIRSIFKVPSEIYSVLKDCKNITVWDLYRKLFKSEKIKQDTVKQAYDSNLSDKELRAVNSILNKKYNGKMVFTWDSLMNYLARLDQYEAIGREESLMLISDYLMMCQQIGIEPKTDGDSLKREHDVVARLTRQKKDEKLIAGMEEPCKFMQQFNYQNGKYLIRGIENWEDLMDEAKQQHNCVAAYAQRITKKHSLIYVMRSIENPGKSLITVELSPDCKVIRQKYYAYNKRVNNSEHSAFLDEWLGFINEPVHAKEIA